MSAAARALLLLFLLAVAAAAVQPLYRVDREVLFLPQDGVALNAHTGQVAWRFPRFTGQTSTDGRGLLIVSWVTDILPAMHRRVTRFCRLRTRDGKQLWCRDWAQVEHWTVGTRGRTWYVHTRGRLEVLSAQDGQSETGFGLRQDHDVSLLPLPAGGLLLLERNHGQVRAALSYHPGAAALSAEEVPPALYPFRGDGHGLLLYARQKGEFFLAAPLRLLWGGHGGAGAGSFPRASLDRHGFFFTDWQGTTPVVRGGTYQGELWQASRAATPDPKLAVSATTAVMLESAPHHTSLLRGWNLASGRLAFTRRLAGDYPAVEAMGNVLLLQSEHDIRLLDAANGRQRWQVERHEGTLAAISQTAVVFWESNGKLAGRARNNGALLWRIQFQAIGFRGAF
ncbi:MAG TPA: PQQ-binding-like beta-propeller repeat protein [Terriglobales bacterium]|nr:PQQ-binding-like beta-propeller repeat protein [Terriglobales bacterium]